MKNLVIKTLLLGMLWSGAVSANAQEAAVDSTPKTQTLLGSAKLKSLGIFVAPTGEFTSVGGNNTWANGASAGLVFNRHWSVGVFGNNTQAVATPLSDNTGLQLRTMQGGGFVEYTFAPHSLVHISMPIQFGGGVARLDSINAVRPGRGNRDFGFNNNNGSQVYFVQPNLRAEMNVARTIKVFAGAGYRLSFGDDLTYTNASGTTSSYANSQLAGFSAQAGVKLGLFGINTQRKPRFPKFGKRKHSHQED
jgi:hypothetical protein